MLLSAPPSGVGPRARDALRLRRRRRPRATTPPFEERFGFPLLEAWAMTETGAAACIMANREPRHVGTRCFGRARVIRRDAHRRRRRRRVGGDGMPGELLVRACRRRSEARFLPRLPEGRGSDREAWADGWFHTGDMVRRERRRQLLLRRPQEERHPPQRREHLRGRSGERARTSTRRWRRARSPPRPTRCAATRCWPASCCARRPTCRRPTKVAASIVRHALARLAYYKAPGYVAFVDALPLTASQKMQRGELRELAKRLPGTPQCIDMRMLKRRQKRLDAAATGQGALSGAGALSGQGGLGGFTGAERPERPGQPHRSRCLAELEGPPGQGTGPDPRALDGIVLGPPPVRRAPKPAAPSRPASARRQRLLTCRALRTKAWPWPCR